MPLLGLLKLLLRAIIAGVGWDSVFSETFGIEGRSLASTKQRLIRLLTSIRKLEDWMPPGDPGAPIDDECAEDRRRAIARKRGWLTKLLPDEVQPLLRQLAHAHDAHVRGTSWRCQPDLRRLNDATIQGLGFTRYTIPGISEQSLRPVLDHGRSIYRRSLDRLTSALLCTDSVSWPTDHGAHPGEHLEFSNWLLGGPAPWPPAAGSDVVDATPTQLQRYRLTVLARAAIQRDFLLGNLSAEETFWAVSRVLQLGAVGGYDSTRERMGPWFAGDAPLDLVGDAQEVRRAFEDETR